MKRIISFIAIFSIVSIFTVKSQDFSTIKDAVLTDSLSCIQSETTVLECCNYLLSTGYKQELNSLYARDYVTQWMTKTANYSFTLHEKFFKVIEDDVILTSRYFAALAKLAIESKYTITETELQSKAISDFITYCTTTKYKVVISKKLQKYVDAKKDNTLDELLKK